MLRQTLLEDVTINGKSQKLIYYFAKAQILEKKMGQGKGLSKRFLQA